MRHHFNHRKYRIVVQHWETISKVVFDEYNKEINENEHIYSSYKLLFNFLVTKCVLQYGLVFEYKYAVNLIV